MNKYEIFNEDCLAGMAKIPDNSVDFICSDLPYGMVSYKQDQKINLAEMWMHFERVLKPCAVVALFSASRFTIELAISNFDWYKYKWVWAKNFSTNFINAKNRPLSKYEEILIFSDGKMTHANKTKNHMIYYPQGLKSTEQTKAYGGNTICLRNGRHKGDARKKFNSVYHSSPSNKAYVEKDFTGYPSDILYYDAPPSNIRYHPNQKPTALLEYLIRTYSNEGELVLDCTMGSGSTGVACMNTGRKFIGFETEKKFFDIAEKRIKEALANKQQELF